MTKSIIEDIRDLIAKSKIEKAIELFRDNCKEYSNELILQSRKYSDLQTQIRDGVISQEHRNLEQNKICKALLSLLSKVEENIKNPNKEASKENQSVVKMEVSEKHPNNEIVKAAKMITQPEKFDKEHPNNEIVKVKRFLKKYL